MKRSYRIEDSRGERLANGPPMMVGGSAGADIVIPGLPDDAVVAMIALSEGHAFVQPLGEETVWHNHTVITESAWLKSGDQLRIAAAVLQWDVFGDEVLIRITDRVDPVPAAVQPPPDPPPGSLPLEDRSARRTPRHGWRWRLVAGVLALLLVAAGFLLLATPLTVSFEPEPDQWSLDGLVPALSLGDRHLVLPGEYRLRAGRSGYRTLDVPLQVSGVARDLHFVLEELPGRLHVRVDPQVTIEIESGGALVEQDDDGAWLLARGSHRITLLSERYLPEEIDIEISGLGKSQDLAVTLRPAWAPVLVVTEPVAARVTVDDHEYGTTPLQLDLLQGTRNLLVTAAGFKPLAMELDVVAGVELTLDDIVLVAADGELVIDTKPSGSTITIDGRFAGTGPLTLPVASGQEHRVVASRAGYRSSERVVSVAPEQSRAISLSLSPEYGVVFLSTKPADATLMIDGKPSGSATRRLQLTTRPHVLEARREGYVPKRITVTPRAGVSQRVEIELPSESQQREGNIAAETRSAGGQTMRLVKPHGAFEMGASRREAGRRANESRRLVELTRPFYISEHEVTNGQFRRFRSGHRTVSADGAGLDGDHQPVANVSWADAARYCNWLSKQEGLTPAYREQGGSMVALLPVPDGYRLPTEAEWAYVARVMNQPGPARYPWAGSYPPASVAGNFADARIADTLADVVPGYDDGHRGTAPVGSFAANAAGLYDLGGNVAEWTHDFYAVYPGEADRKVADPTGPVSGEHHVVRGSSWRHGAITELRLSYRDYSKSPRPDLGFRVARYTH